VFVSDIVPVGIIAVGTVGSSILLLMLLLALAFFLYRQRKGSECTLLMRLCEGMHTYSMCLSVFLSSTLPHLSFRRSMKKVTYASHSAFYLNEINEYSYHGKVP